MTWNRQNLVVLSGVIIIGGMLSWSWMNPPESPNLNTPKIGISDEDRRQMGVASRKSVFPPSAGFSSVAEAEDYVHRLEGTIVRNELDRNQIHTLKFTTNKLIDDDLVVLTQLSDMKSLRLFEASLFDGTGLKYIDGCDRLESLFVCDSVLSDEHLVHLQNLQHLDFLDLERRHIDGSGFHFLEKLPVLETVVLDDNPIVEANFETLAHFPALEDLSAIRTRFTDQSCAAFASNPTLKRLNLAETLVTDDGIDSLAKIPQLTVLNLSSTSITDASLRILSASPRLFNLDISNTAVTDEGLELLAACPALEFLDISGTSVSRSTLLKIATAPNIRKITVRNTAIVSEDLKEFDSGSVRIVIQ